MEKEFALQSYRIILEKINKYSTIKILSINKFISDEKKKNVIILRHDVDRNPNNALKMAKIEASLGIESTYYFRILPDIFIVDIIKEIASLGHEIGYHYETMDTSKGDVDKAFNEFKKNLTIFREIYPVTTVCMHGSPLSKWDNKDIWKKYNYKELGIIAEPYFDFDYNEVFYLTDAGRIWNNNKSNVRDKVNTSFNFEIKSLKDFIILLNEGKLPNKILINTHPHLWTDNIFQWYNILLYQGLKNIVKKQLIKLRG